MTLNLFCFYLCIACIVVGLVCALATIWLPDAKEAVWKALVSMALIFGAGLLTMGTNYMFSKVNTSMTTPTVLKTDGK